MQEASAQTEAQPQSAPQPGAASNPLNAQQERQWAMFTHLSTLSGLVIPLGSVLGPLILWLIGKDRSAFVDRHGKEAVNFQITILIAALVSAILVLVLIGILLLIAVVVLWLVFSIMATLKANAGEEYRYPMTIRFIK